MPSPLRSAALSATLAALLALGACSAGADPEPDAGASTGASTRASTRASTSTSASPSASASSTPRASRGESYVALGDSYTAAPLVASTDTAGGCLQSEGNYPHLVARELGYDLRDVSCAGATSASMIGVQRLPDGSVRPPQFDALGRGTDLVTIGIGGNDVGLLTTLAGTCFPLASQDPTGSPCTDRLRAPPRTCWTAWGSSRPGSARSSTVSATAPPARRSSW